MIIVHITNQKNWQAALEAGIYTGESLEKDGFIHCCLPKQTEQVLQDWFSGVPNLLLVEIDTDLIISNLVFENLDLGEEKYPHIYGPVNLEAVINVKDINKKKQEGNDK